MNIAFSFYFSNLKVTIYFISNIFVVETCCISIFTLIHSLEIIDLITLGVVNNFTSSYIAALGRYLENPPPYPPCGLTEIISQTPGKNSPRHAPFFPQQRNSHSYKKHAATLLANMKAYSRTESSHIMVKRILTNHKYSQR